MAILRQSVGSVHQNIFPQGWLKETRPTNHITDHDPEILTEDHRDTIVWSAELVIHGIDLLV